MRKRDVGTTAGLGGGREKRGQEREEGGEKEVGRKDIYSSLPSQWLPPWPSPSPAPWGDPLPAMPVGSVPSVNLSFKTALTPRGPFLC